MIFDPTLDTPARPNEFLVSAWRDLALCGDLDGGVERMRWRERVWLPLEHSEEPAQYTHRLNRSDLYPGFTAALDDAVAQPFAKPVQVEGAQVEGSDERQPVPPEFEPIILNADGDGNDITQFGRHLMRSAVKYGFACVLPDYTAMKATPGATVTRADEANANPRPFWRMYERPDVLGWRTFKLPNGQEAFSEVRLHEIRTVPDGTWGEKKAEFIRVIRRDSYELWLNKAYNPPKVNSLEPASRAARYYDIQENRPQQWVQVDAGPFGPEGGFESVPLVVVYTGYTSFMQAKPAMLDLAESNLTHWRKKSDYDNLCHYAGVPILFARGLEKAELAGAAIGAGTVIRAGNPDASLGFVEHSGSALQVMRDDLDGQERRMEQIGVRPHVERTSGASATAAFLNADGAATDVQAWAQAVDTALEQLFDLSAEWMGRDDLRSAVDVTIYKEFARPSNPQDIAMIQADVDAGHVSVKTYLREAKRRGLYSDDLDINAEAEQAEGAKAEKAAEAAEKLKQINANQPGAMPGNGGAMPDKGAKPEQRDAA